MQAAGDRMAVWRARSDARAFLTCRKPHKQTAGAQTATIAAAVVISILLATCLVALRRKPSLPYIPSMIKFLKVQDARVHAACRCTGPAQPLLCFCAGLSDHDPPRMKCTPPGADERLAMFGNLHGYSHAISTSSSRAQQLFDQARLQPCKHYFPEIVKDPEF